MSSTLLLIIVEWFSKQHMQHVCRFWSLTALKRRNDLQRSSKVTDIKSYILKEKYWPLMS